MYKVLTEQEQKRLEEELHEELGVSRLSTVYIFEDGRVEIEFYYGDSCGLQKLINVLQKHGIATGVVTISGDG